MTDAVRVFAHHDATDKLRWRFPYMWAGGDFGKVDCVSDFACQIVDAAEKIVDITYLREAKYPHPLYLMRYGANKPVCVRVK